MLHIVSILYCCLFLRNIIICQKKENAVFLCIQMYSENLVIQRFWVQMPTHQKTIQHITELLHY